MSKRLQPFRDPPKISVSKFSGDVQTATSRLDILPKMSAETFGISKRLLAARHTAIFVDIFRAISAFIYKRLQPFRDPPKNFAEKVCGIL